MHLTSANPSPPSPAPLYQLAIAQAEALCAPDIAPISALANVSALLYEALPDINWVGFYLLHGDQLLLGPFQGRVACTNIALGKGVCGTAADLRIPLLVPDVHIFPGHIACDSASRSEIVLPLCAPKLMGVLDIDSPKRDRFSREDMDGLTQIAQIVSRSLKHCAWPSAWYHSQPKS